MKKCSTGNYLGEIRSRQVHGCLFAASDKPGLALAEEEDLLACFCRFFKKKKNHNWLDWAKGAASWLVFSRFRSRSRILGESLYSAIGTISCAVRSSPRGASWGAESRPTFLRLRVLRMQQCLEVAL